MDGSILPEVKATETGVFLQQAKARIATYAAHSKATNTWKAYQADLRDFTAWCETYSVAALPAAPDTVAVYLTDLASLTLYNLGGKEIKPLCCKIEAEESVI
jgi:hypothetical protein